MSGRNKGCLAYLEELDVEVSQKEVEDKVRVCSARLK